MSQRPQSGHQNTQPGFFPEAPNNKQDKNRDPSPTTYKPQVSIQDSQPIVHSRQVSIQEPLSIIHDRWVSTQDPPPVSSRRVSIQDTPSIISGRRLSIQDTPSFISGRRLSIQDIPSIISGRRLSIQDIPSIISGRRVSIQNSPSIISGRRVSIQDTPSIISSRRVSIQNSPSIISGRWVSIQDTPSVTYSRWANTRDVPPVFQTHHHSVQSPPLITHTVPSNTESINYGSQVGIQDHPPTTGNWPTTRAKVDVPPSITHSPEASIKSVESIIWTSQESFKDSVSSSQFNQSTLDGDIHSSSSGNFVEVNAGGFQNSNRHSPSLLPIGWWLLHEAKKISHQLSLALSLAGMVIIGLISLGQPWIHFRVPLTPPGDPAGSVTIPINTIFFVRCPDISCLHEYNQNAYLLDFSWAFLLIASITSFCLCIILIHINFFTSSKVPALDLSSVILSILTGISVISGVVFYLMQAQEYLQDGMTYRLGCSFYLAWTGVFFFLMTGFFSYLNYANFWSIPALQATWTGHENGRTSSLFPRPPAQHLTGAKKGQDSL